jgi:hypothetical protein
MSTAFGHGEVCAEAKGLEAPMSVLLDRANRAAHPRSHGDLVEIGEIAQHDRIALTSGETTQGFD